MTEQLISKLLIVGTVAFDKIETPFGDSGVVIGGSATYASIAASLLNVESSIISIVGSDFPGEYISLLQNKNIDTSGIETLENSKTFFWAGKYDKNMISRKTLATELNVLSDFNPIISENHRNPEIVLLGNLHPKIQLSILNQLEKKPKCVILDTMDFWISKDIDDLHTVLKHVDIITINDDEARLLSKEHSLVKAAKVIQGLGVKNVIIKKGEHGALAFSKQEMFFAPAIPVKDIIDPTGAGDSFAGGLCAYLTTQEQITFNTIRKAIVHGTCIASLCVEDFGTKNIIRKDNTQVNQRIEEFKVLTKYND